MPEIGRR